MLLRYFYCVCAAVILLAAPALRAQISPASVIVVANSADKESMELAKFYMEKRGIPQGNLFLVKSPRGETITWEQFITTLFNPLREQLVQKGWINGVLSGRNDPYGRLELAPLGHKIDFMVLCRVPLRIRRDDARAALDPATRAGGAGGTFRASEAAVDSELALLAAPQTPLQGPLPNPLFNKPQTRLAVHGQVVRVARLDGAPGWPQRMIEAGLEAEQTGLRGMAYIDLGHRYPSGDEWLKKAGEQLSQLYYPVITEPEKRIMNWNDRADGAAFFFGWWSPRPAGPMLQKEYRFPAGALGWDIYSFSASVIRTPNVWAPIMMRAGITGTAGNVYEPYLTFVHRPDLFVQGLVQGMSAGEAAYYSLPTLSWMCVWSGDPLYQPFKVGLDEQLKQVAVDPASAGAQYVVLRQAERLRAVEGGQAALDYLQASLGSVQGLALSYETARLLAAQTEDRRAAALLAPFEQAAAFNVADIPLASKAAELLVSLRKREEALGVYRVILTSPDLDDAAWLTYVPKAAPLARQFGQAALGDEWTAKVAEIQARQAEEARKRAEERERKKQEAEAAAAAKAAKEAQQVQQAK